MLFWEPPKFKQFTVKEHTCPNCCALSLDFASSENRVTSFMAHISPLSLKSKTKPNQGKEFRKRICAFKLTSEANKLNKKIERTTNLS